MSDIVGELARVRDAYDRPTLRLLTSTKWAPMTVAIFRSAFSRDRRSVPAERLHAQVDAYLSELASAGIEVPPNQSGRALCLAWTHGQWLLRSAVEGGEEYSLTSHAIEALDMVNALSRERALISESRLNTILDAVRRWAFEASPDAEVRIARLDAQIRELEDERRRLAAGDVSMAVSDERMLDGYMNLMDLIWQLPGDFKRVEEAVHEIHRRVLDSFRAEQRPIGEVIDDYLAKSDSLMSSTAEGRAFEGAFVLLRDEALLLEIREHLQAILRHPFADALNTQERREFLAIVGLIRQGTDDVLEQRHRLSATLREHIVSHDALRERELDQLLRSVERELVIWMRNAGPRATVPLELVPEALAIEHLRERFHDPQTMIVPPPLDDIGLDAPTPLSLEELRKQGGPLLADLRQALIGSEAVEGDGSLGALFNLLAVDLRRPVEIFGLLQLMERVDAFDHGLGREVFRTIRPDGSARDLVAPRLVPTNEDRTSLRDLDQEQP